MEKIIDKLKNPYVISGIAILAVAGICFATRKKTEVTSGADGGCGCSNKDYSSNISGATANLFKLSQEKYCIGRIISDLDFLRNQFNYEGYTTNQGISNSYAMIDDIENVNHDGVQSKKYRDLISAFTQNYKNFIPDSNNQGTYITARMNLITHIKFTLNNYLISLNQPMTKSKV